MNDFKLFNGQRIDNLGKYIIDYYKQYPDIKIYVGTDSAQFGKNTKYATAIGLLRPRKGVHVIYRKISVPKIRDIFTRLWNETEYSLEVANYVHDIMKDIYDHDINEKIPIIHLDFNKSPKYKSYVLNDTSTGYLKGMGYNVYSKPDSWIATDAADLLVKS